MAKGPLRLCGVICDVDLASGRCVAIRRLSLAVPEAAPTLNSPAN
jgi:hypothetical protein